MSPTWLFVNTALLHRNLLTKSQYTNSIPGGVPVQVTIYRRLSIGRDGHLDQYVTRSW